MVSITLQIDEATLAYWEQRAAEEHLPLETLLQQFVSHPLEPQQIQKWAAVGLFDSGYNETGSQADDILNAEWNPD
jgi:hypothetical protein